MATVLALLTLQTEVRFPITDKRLNIVKEEFECNELFTPDMGMARIFDQTVSVIFELSHNKVSSVLASSDRGC